MVCVPLYWHKQSDSVWVNTHRSGTCLDAVVPLFTRVCRNPDGFEFPPPVEDDRGLMRVGTRGLGRVNHCKGGGKHGRSGYTTMGVLLSKQQRTQGT